MVLFTVEMQLAGDAVNWRLKTQTELHAVVELTIGFLREKMGHVLYKCDLFFEGHFFIQKALSGLFSLL